MARGTDRRNGIYQDDLADVADAFDAVDVLWARLRSWCGQPYVSRDDVDSVSDELRRIERGLAATRKWIVERMEKGNGRE